MLALPNCSLLGNSSSNYYASDYALGEDPLTRYALLIYSVLFLLIGVPGDLLSLFLWYRRISGSQGSTALFLTVLCAVDTSVLVQGCLRHLLITTTCHDLRILLGCTWPIFVYTWLSNTSVWIICLMCVERLVCVCWPFSMKSVCRLRNGAAALAMAAGLLAACDLPLLFIIDPDTCMERPDFSRVREVFSVVDSIVYSYLPFALIVGLNAVILMRLGRQRRNLAAATSRGGGGARGGGGSGGGGGSRQASNKIFATVFAMAVSHLLFTAPIVVWYHLLSDQCDINSIPCSRIELACQVLERLNHLIHFFIFSFTSSLFMADLKAFLARVQAACGCRACPQLCATGVGSGNGGVGGRGRDGGRGGTNRTGGGELELRETRRPLLPDAVDAGPGTAASDKADEAAAGKEEDTKQ